MNKTLLLQAFFSFPFVCVELRQEKNIQNDSAILFPLILHHQWTASTFFFLQVFPDFLLHQLHFNSKTTMTIMEDFVKFKFNKIASVFSGEMQIRIPACFSITTKGLGMCKYDIPKPLYC